MKIIQLISRLCQCQSPQISCMSSPQQNPEMLGQSRQQQMNKQVFCGPNPWTLAWYTCLREPYLIFPMSPTVSVTWCQLFFPLWLVLLRRKPSSSSLAAELLAAKVLAAGPLAAGLLAARLLAAKVLTAGPPDIAARTGSSCELIRQAITWPTVAGIWRSYSSSAVSARALKSAVCLVRTATEPWDTGAI